MSFRGQTKAGLEFTPFGGVVQPLYSLKDVDIGTGRSDDAASKGIDDFIIEPGLG